MCVQRTASARRLQNFGADEDEDDQSSRDGVVVGWDGSKPSVVGSAATNAVLGFRGVVKTPRRIIPTLAPRRLFFGRKSGEVGRQSLQIADAHHCAPLLTRLCSFEAGLACWRVVAAVHSMGDVQRAVRSGCVVVAEALGRGQVHVCQYTDAVTTSRRLLADAAMMPTAGRKAAEPWGPHLIRRRGSTSDLALLRRWVKPQKGL